MVLKRKSLETQMVYSGLTCQNGEGEVRQSDFYVMEMTGWRLAMLTPEREHQLSAQTLDSEQRWIQAEVSP